MHYTVLASVKIMQGMIKKTQKKNKKKINPLWSENISFFVLFLVGIPQADLIPHCWNL